MRHEGSAYFQDDMVAYLRGEGIVIMTSGGGGEHWPKRCSGARRRCMAFPTSSRLNAHPLAWTSHPCGVLWGLRLDQSRLGGEVPNSRDSHGSRAGEALCGVTNTLLCPRRTAGT